MTTYYPVWGIEITKSHFVKYGVLNGKDRTYMVLFFFALQYMGKMTNRLKNRKLDARIFKVSINMV